MASDSDARAKRLDAITNEQVQRLKLTLADRAPKTVNNVLTALSTLLKRAVDWASSSGCDEVRLPPSRRAAPADKSRSAAQAEYSPLRRARKNTRETANERSE